MAIMSVSAAAFTLMQARQDLTYASSANGLVSVKLQRIRDQLESKLAATLKEFDAIQRRYAKKEEDGATPVSLGADLVLFPAGTPAYELDPSNGPALADALEPILAETITLEVATLTAADAQSIVIQAEQSRTIGRTLALFTGDL